MTWPQIHQLQQAEQNYAIANVTRLTIADSPNVLENQLYSLGEGQTIVLNANYAQLMNDVFSRAASSISEGSPNVQQFMWNRNLSDAFNNHQVRWVDTINNMFDPSKLALISDHYYGDGSLQRMILRDSIANFKKLNHAEQAESFMNVLNEVAHGDLTINLSDSINNLYSVLVGSESSSFKAQQQSIFNDVAVLRSRIQIQDSVANLKAAVSNGRFEALKNAASTIFNDGRDSAAFCGFA
jgi:hypothetical protein